MKKIVIRQSVVERAIGLLDKQPDELQDEPVMEQQVYVPSRLIPESFSADAKGGLVLLFQRANQMDAWQLDPNRFVILDGL